MSNKPWIDVVTTATPRTLTSLGMLSFLRKFDDRGDFRLRWIFYLVQHPNPGLEQLWEPTMNQAVTASGWFDDAIIMGLRSHSCYGKTVFRAIELVEHPTLWIEDDYLWRRHFQLAKISRGLNFFSFVAGKVGSTGPAYWDLETITYLRDNYPPAEQHQRMCEKTMTGIMGRRKWRSNDGVPVGHRYHNDMGKSTFARLEVGKFSAARAYIDPVTGAYHRMRSEDAALRAIGEE